MIGRSVGCGVLLFLDQACGPYPAVVDDLEEEGGADDPTEEKADGEDSGTDVDAVEHGEGAPSEVERGKRRADFIGFFEFVKPIQLREIRALDQPHAEPSNE